MLQKIIAIRDQLDKIDKTISQQTKNILDKSQIGQIKFKKRMDEINRVCEDLSESFLGNTQQFIEQVSLFIEDAHIYSRDLEKLQIGEGYLMHKLQEMDKDLSKIFDFLTGTLFILSSKNH